MKDKRMRKQRMQNSYLVTTCRTWLTFIGKFLKTMLIIGELNYFIVTNASSSMPASHASVLILYRLFAEE